MKKNLPIILASMLVVGALTFSVSLLHAQPANNVAPGTSEAQNIQLMHSALQDLKMAKGRLVAAKGDFDGHRQAALKALDQSIAEVRAALQYSNKKH